MERDDERESHQMFPIIKRDDERESHEMFPVIKRDIPHSADQPAAKIVSGGGKLTIGSDDEAQLFAFDLYDPTG